MAICLLDTDLIFLGYCIINDCKALEHRIVEEGQDLICFNYSLLLKEILPHTSINFYLNRQMQYVHTAGPVLSSLTLI